MVCLGVNRAGAVSHHFCSGATGDGIVLIEHRHHVHGQQVLCGSGQVLAEVSIGKVVAGDQNLCSLAIHEAKQGVIEGHEPALPCCCCCTTWTLGQACLVRASTKQETLDTRSRCFDKEPKIQELFALLKVCSRTGSAMQSYVSAERGEGKCEEVRLCQIGWQMQDSSEGKTFTCRRPLHKQE